MQKILAPVAHKKMWLRRVSNVIQMQRATPTRLVIRGSEANTVTIARDTVKKRFLSAGMENGSCVTDLTTSMEALATIAGDPSRITQCGRLPLISVRGGGMEIIPNTLRSRSIRTTTDHLRTWYFKPAKTM
jgi:hypothetical protein